jgi:hypothetical protein
MALLSDVHDRAQHPRWPTGPVGFELSASMDPALLAGIHADDSVLAVERMAAPEDLIEEVGDHAFAVGGVDERRPARHGSVERGIDPEDPVEPCRAGPSARRHIERVRPDPPYSLYLIDVGGLES